MQISFAILHRIGDKIPVLARRRKNTITDDMQADSRMKRRFYQELCHQLQEMQAVDPALPQHRSSARPEALTGCLMTVRPYLRTRLIGDHQGGGVQLACAVRALFAERCIVVLIICCRPSIIDRFFCR